MLWRNTTLTYLQHVFRLIALFVFLISFQACNGSSACAVLFCGSACAARFTCSVLSSPHPFFFFSLLLPLRALSILFCSFNKRSTLLDIPRFFSALAIFYSFPKAVLTSFVILRSVANSVRDSLFFLRFFSIQPYTTSIVV